MKHLIVIGGATATGKTALAIKLARHFGAAILSADSRQFFREMSIGTAKPSAEELAAAKHYFIDNLSIKDQYSVGDFEREALEVLDELFQTTNIVIMVGGSGLYLRAVCEGLDVFPEVSSETKAMVAREFAAGGIAWMQQQLKSLDPRYFSIVDQQNPARMRRALEVCLETGRPYSSFRQNSKTERPFSVINILLELPRPILYERIDNRVELMIAQGLEEEARNLLPYQDKPALKTVGYEEFFAYFRGEMPLEETILKIKQHSRNYAKRQATWFRKHGEWAGFHPDGFDELLGYINAQLKA